MNELRSELARVGIRGRLARRIELELEDHRSCDPSAPLGESRLIAERFAAELRIPCTRRATYLGFAALALAAGLLAVQSRGVSAAGGWPDVFGARGLAVSLAGLAMVVGGQIAFVTGVLALWRTVWQPVQAEDLRLVQRRLSVALVAGGGVLAGELVQAVALEPALPAWWLGLALTAVLVPAVALGGAAQRLRQAVAITPVVQSRPRAFPAPLVVAIGVGAVLLMAVGSTLAERSWIEGTWRGGIEAVAFVLCFFALGRRLGIRR
jgi:hypothetical protein